MKKRVGFGITNHYLEASRRSKGERKQFNYSTCTIVQDLALILIVDPDTKHQIKKNHNFAPTQNWVKIIQTRTRARILFMKFLKARGLVDNYTL